MKGRGGPLGFVVAALLQGALLATVGLGCGKLGPPERTPPSQETPPSASADAGADEPEDRKKEPSP